MIRHASMHRRAFQNSEPHSFHGVFDRSIADELPTDFDAAQERNSRAIKHRQIIRKAGKTEHRYERP